MRVYHAQRDPDLSTIGVARIVAGSDRGPSGHRIQSDPDRITVDTSRIAADTDRIATDTD